MKKVIALMLGLAAGTASSAQQTAPAPQTPVMIVPQPHITVTADQKIKLLISPQPTTVKIALWDADGHALYTENVPLQHGLGQQFTISSLAVGTYRLTLTTDGQTIVRTFVVQPVPNQTFIVMES